LDKYDNIRNLEGYEGPVAVLLAGEDEVVPVKHGLNLYESLTTKRKLWVFEGYRHNEVPIGPHLDWWGEVMEFVSQ
jgi:hypothetical protein